jgi:hypothetical protein
MVWRLSLSSFALVAGCLVGDEGGFAGESYMPPDHPPYGCMDGSSSGSCETTAGDAAIECAGSSDCPGDQICAASFDGDIGTFRCDSLCIANEDQASWCFDDAACCDSNATCTRGLCIAGDAGTSTGEADSSSSGDGSSSGDASTSGGSSSTSTGGTG